MRTSISPKVGRILRGADGMNRLRLLALTTLLVVSSAATGAEEVDYLRQVKPILSKRCYACHGGLRQRAGLRLDTAALIRKGGKGGAVVVEGQGEESALLGRVLATDATRMPPEGEGEALKADEVAVLKAWIDAGARGPEAESPQADPRGHWAYQTPRRIEVPKAGDPSWVRNPIDAFVADEHQKRGLVPAPQAGKHVLLRRVFLDLIGLPPTRQELRDFMADTSPDAYEKAVDRLLDSPRYGERWARHWMDVWRYSDWYGKRDIGQHRNSRMHVWRWRDWIVESINADKPYDRMIVEMLAGDELAPADDDIQRATGFLGRNFYVYNRNVWLQDTVEYTAMGLLGVTLKCCRCHDHKYDPIAQKDYYRFKAFFEPHDVRADRLPGKPETVKVTNSAGSGQVSVLKDGFERVFDAHTDAPTYLLARGDEKSPVKDSPLGPGVPDVIARKPIAIESVVLPPQAFYPDLRSFLIKERLDASQAALATAKAAAALMSARPEHGRDACPGEAEVTPAEVKAEAEARLAEKAVAAREADLTSLRARIAAEEARYAAFPTADDHVQALALEAGKAERIAAACRAEEALAKAEVGVVAARMALKPGDEKTKAAVAVAEKASEGARLALEAARKKAGEESKTYEPLGPVYPRTSTGRRLALARWIADRDNPLTARVAVNHIWLRHFGAALVPTVANFGLNGTPPTHPALLDWLAVELVDRGWSTKALHRLMVTSSTYRMRSRDAGPDDPNRAIDRANTYLWRANPRRMEAEVVRDSILHLSGSLDLTAGGPDLDPALAEIVPRRSVYFRHTPDDVSMFLLVFDAPNPVECYSREENIIPQQALALANGGLAQDQARVLARSLVKPIGGDGPDADAAFVVAAFEHLLGRSPTPQEALRGGRFLREQATLFADRQALSAFPSGPKARVSPATDSRLRAWENLVHVLFNHNDFVTVR